MNAPYTVLTPEEAALFIRRLKTPPPEEAARPQKSIVAGGFTLSGSPTATARAYARLRLAEGPDEDDERLRIISGASSAVQEILAPWVDWCAPYQASKMLQARINSGQAQFLDMRLSQVDDFLVKGLLGEIDVLILQICGITPRGVVLTSSVGITPTAARLAKHIILEWNQRQSSQLLHGMHDLLPYDRSYSFPAECPANLRIGSDVLPLHPEKVVGVVYSDEEELTQPFPRPGPEGQAIAANLSSFVKKEIRLGRLPSKRIGAQSGVGPTANEVLWAMLEDRNMPEIYLDTEVAQDGALDMLARGNLLFIATGSLTISEGMMQRMREDPQLYRGKLFLRPQWITNHPVLIRSRVHLASNGAVEAGVLGGINSSRHVRFKKGGGALGKLVPGLEVVHGQGGSRDFENNAELAVFLLPAARCEGRISGIVPTPCYTDHPKGAVIITDKGVADLRGLSPAQCVEAMTRIAHEDYRELLRDYGRLSAAGSSNAPFHSRNDSSFHDALQLTGDMRNAKFV